MQIILRASYTQTPNKQQIQIEISSTNYYQKKKKIHITKCNKSIELSSIASVHIHHKRKRGS